jgi:hypothetical protein
MTNYGRITFRCPSDSAGFFSNYFSVVSTIGVCLTQKLIPYVDSSNTWFNPTCDFENDLVSNPDINPWNWWFVQDKREDATYTDINLDRGGISHIPKEFLAHSNLPILRQIAKDFCKIQLFILEEEETLYKQYIEGKNTLGILARGTEMLVHHQEYPKAPAEIWPNTIKFCLEQNPDIDNIFLVSDDKRIIESVLNAYPETKYLKHFFRSTNQTEEELSNKIKPWWLSSSGNTLNHRRRVGEESLIQTRLLSRCPYFVGSHSGMFNAVNFFNETPFKNSYLI